GGDDARAVPSADELRHRRRGPVAGAADVEQPAAQRVGDQALPRATAHREGAGDVGCDEAVAVELGDLGQAEVGRGRGGVEGGAGLWRFDGLAVPWRLEGRARPWRLEGRAGPWLEGRSRPWTLVGRSR